MFRRALELGIPQFRVQRRIEPIRDGIRGIHHMKQQHQGLNTRCKLCLMHHTKNIIQNMLKITHRRFRVRKRSVDPGQHGPEQFLPHALSNVGLDRLGK